MKRLAILCLLSAALGGLAATGWRPSLSVDNPSAAQETSPWPAPVPIAAQSQPARAPANLPDSLTEEEKVNVRVYQQVNRSVVNINTKGVTGNPLLVFEVVSEGEGSGTVIDRAGHILTNFHVIEGAREIQATLFDGQSYAARLVGSDPDSDVAVLKVEAPAEALVPVDFGTSGNLLVGQRVFAIGSPFGFERTLSTGIISSLDRMLPRRHRRGNLKSIIQIDASINPGNSGGPLLDSHGRMIGMNTAIASTTGESAGVGFAIPINTISRVVPQLIRDGRVRRPESGIVRVRATERGLMILAVARGGPAERAGLQGPKVEKLQKRQGPFVVEYQKPDFSVADIIVAVDGRPIKTGDDFLDAVEAKQPGEQVILTVLRAGQARQVALQLDAQS